MDLQIDGEGRPFVLEVNTIPGMTRLSDLPAEAEAAGISYDELVAEVLRSAHLDTGCAAGRAHAGENAVGPRGRHLFC